MRAGSAISDATGAVLSWLLTVRYSFHDEGGSDAPVYGLVPDKRS